MQVYARANERWPLHAHRVMNATTQDCRSKMGDDFVITHHRNLLQCNRPGQNGGTEYGNVMYRYREDRARLQRELDACRSSLHCGIMEAFTTSVSPSLMASSMSSSCTNLLLLIVVTTLSGRKIKKRDATTTTSGNVIAKAASTQTRSGRITKKSKSSGSGKTKTSSSHTCSSQPQNPSWLNRKKIDTKHWTILDTDSKKQRKVSMTPDKKYYYIQKSDGKTLYF